MDKGKLLNLFYFIFFIYYLFIYRNKNRSCAEFLTNTHDTNLRVRTYLNLMGCLLRTFALIVCAQSCCAGNATVIYQASLHVLVTIDWFRR